MCRSICVCRYLHSARPLVKAWYVFVDQWGWKGKKNSPQLCKVTGIRFCFFPRAMSHRSRTASHKPGGLLSSGPHLWPVILQRWEKQTDI